MSHLMCSSCVLFLMGRFYIGKYFHCCTEQSILRYTTIQSTEQIELLPQNFLICVKLKMSGLSKVHNTHYRSGPYGETFLFFCGFMAENRDVVQCCGSYPPLAISVGEGGRGKLCADPSCGDQGFNGKLLGAATAQRTSIISETPL